MQTLQEKWEMLDQRFLNDNVVDVIKRAYQLMNMFGLLPSYQLGDYLGCILILAPDKTAASYCTVMVGSIPNDKKEGVCHLAYEKLGALRNNEKAKSSHEIRDEDDEVFGGAIALSTRWQTDFHAHTFTGKAYIACSGLATELADEAIVLVLALDMGWLKERQAKNLAKASQNPFFWPLRNLAKQHPLGK